MLIMKIQALLGSRRFWAAALGVVAVLLEDAVGLSKEQVAMIVALLGSWIVGDSLQKTQ